LVRVEEYEESAALVSLGSESVPAMVQESVQESARESVHASARESAKTSLETEQQWKSEPE